MSTVIKSGNISSDEEWNTFNDVIQIGANVIIDNGVTITGSFGAATLQSQTSDIEIPGNFSITWNGRPVFDGNYNVRFVWKSTVALPQTNSWVGHIFNSIDAGGSMTYNIIRHAQTAMYCSGSYNTANLTLDKNISEEGGLIFRNDGTVSQTFGDFEMRDSAFDSVASNIGALLILSGTTQGFGTLVFKNCITPNTISLQGTIVNIDTLVCDNITQFTTNEGIIHKRGSTPTCNITNAYIWTNSPAVDNGSFLYNWTTGMVSVNGGFVLAGPPIMNSTTNINVLLSGMDLTGTGIRAFDVNGGGNITGCRVKGFSADGRRRGDITTVETASGGTKNGSGGFSDGNYTSMDSVLLPAASDNLPKTISTVSSSVPTSNGGTFAFTLNHPGRSWLVFSKTAIPVGKGEDLQNYSIRTNPDYEEWIDYSLNNRLQKDLGERVTVLSGLLASETDYFWRAVGLSPKGELFWSDELTHTTGAGSTSPIELLVGEIV